MAAVNLRKDSYHAQESIGELQYLVGVASNIKEELDYTLSFYSRKIVQMEDKIKSKRSNLISMLEKNAIDPTQFPVLNQILADDVFQDTAPVQAQSITPVEDAMRKNIPLEEFSALSEKINAKGVVNRLNELIDEIRKMKLYKAELESNKGKLLLAKKSYERNEQQYGDAYSGIKKDLENFLALHKSLAEMKYIFSNTPMPLTSDHLGKLHDNRMGIYSSYYATKKKSINTQALKIRSNYDDVERYSSVSVQVNFTFIIDTMTSLSIYFGDQTDTPSSDIIATQYTGAYQNKTEVIRRITSFMQNTITFIATARAALDAIRGISGIGDSEVEQLLNQAIIVAQSPVNARKVEQSDLIQIQNTNKNVMIQAQRTVESFKGVVQGGIDSLDDAFIRAQKDLLYKMALNMGYATQYVKDSQVSLEDHVRAKVRAKFGNIPFEDEDEITENGQKVFVKTSELDKSITPWKRKSTSDGEKLLAKTTGIPQW